MSLIKRPRILKMAPPGFHIVKRHVKISENGIKYYRRDLEDPVISIAAGIRWISYKYSSLPKGTKKDTFNTFRNYYRYRDGKEYAQKIFDMYNASIGSRIRK